MPDTTRATHILPPDWLAIDQKYSTWLCNTARRKFFLNGDDAKDVVQDVWRRVWEYHQKQQAKQQPGQPWFKLDPDKPSFRPYLIVQLRWAAVDRIRRTKKMQSLAEDHDAPATSDQPYNEEEAVFSDLLESPNDLENLLRELWGKWGGSEAQQFAVILRLLKGEKTQKEIAQELGYSEGWVSIAKARFLTAMREYFQTIKGDR